MLKQLIVNDDHVLPVNEPDQGLSKSSCQNCGCENEVAIAVDTDDLIEFISQAEFQVRMFIRHMSIEAATSFNLGSSTRGDVTYLYLRGCWNPEKNPGVALVMDWIRKLACQNRKVYFVRIGSKPEDFEEIRLEQCGTMGIDLKKSVYFRAA